MKNASARKHTSFAPSEKESARLLMEKMGLSKKEMQEIHTKYGVHPSKLIELMQLSKYPFIYTGKAEGQCEPCFTRGRLKAI
jgi:hypothetical protein